MYRTGMATLCAALLLASCSEPEPNRELYSLGMEAVKAKLKDPASATFDRLELGSYQGRPVLCGHVNARNGLGGMTGAQRFVTDGGEATILEEIAGPGAMTEVWLAAC